MAPKAQSIKIQKIFRKRKKFFNQIIDFKYSSILMFHVPTQKFTFIKFLYRHYLKSFLLVSKNFCLELPH